MQRPLVKAAFAICMISGGDTGNRGWMICKIPGGDTGNGDGFLIEVILPSNRAFSQTPRWCPQHLYQRDFWIASPQGDVRKIHSHPQGGVPTFIKAIFGLTSQGGVSTAFKNDFQINFIKRTIHFIKITIFHNGTWNHLFLYCCHN